MQVRDKVIVVTGGASGIGRALCERFAREGTRHVAVVDRDRPKAETVARAIGGSAHGVDVTDESALRAMIEEVTAAAGPIDLFCSNAGVVVMDPELRNVASAASADWHRAWAVNVMAHVYAARALLPRMIARRQGYFLHTISAAGLLSQIGSAIYSTTKHAAVGFAESLAIAHRDDGIRVSMLCPQGVDTPMLQSISSTAQNLDGVLTPDQVADCALEGLAREAFVILPHPQVATYMQRKTADYDRWIGGMAKLRRSVKR
jgi:NAD(P)-dependent dehydrogenase (short-subunit alcohol dehydrogenase family)